MPPQAFARFARTAAADAIGQHDEYRIGQGLAAREAIILEDEVAFAMVRPGGVFRRLSEGGPA
jgi:hypothetical protein